MKYKFLINRLLILTLLLSPLKLQSQQPAFMEYTDHPWVDSLISEMSLEKKIAQSIFVATWSDRDIGHYRKTGDIIREYGIGGLVFFQGTPEKQVELIKHYQNLSDIPLAIALDGEWGAAMRLGHMENYPYQMTLGAIVNDSLIYEMGKRVAREFKLLGLDINLAPVADINNNPANPVINYRSFGENRDNVAAKLCMYLRGMQDNGVLATAKHFPGHGDTDTDSHYDLPLIRHNRQRFDSLELYPFRQAIKAGVGAVMSAHLNIPALDSSSGLPATLSRQVMTGLLKDELGFRGLAVTDAMNMKAVTKHFNPGEAEAIAFMAGNDIIEFVSDVSQAIKAVRDYYDQGKIPYSQIENSTRKILAFKYWLSLHETMPDALKAVEISGSGASKSFIRQLYANALTVLNNHNNIIPVRRLDQKKIACLAINSNKKTAFQSMAGKYTRTDNFYWTEGSTSADSLLNELEGYDLVITGIFDTDQRPYRNFGISQAANSFIEKLGNRTNMLAVYFGNPYAIDRIPGLQEAEGLILAYQENTYTEELSAQLIFGGTSGHGRLPVTINDRYREGYGITTPGFLRLQYGYPEDAGLSSVMIEKKIDSLVHTGLQAGAFPGCEVIIARKGVVFFHKCYGYHTYRSRIKVQDNDLYDLASITKVAGATTSLMVLDGKGLFSPDDRLIDYVPEMRFSDKKDLKFRDILAHQAGLYPWIPYWKNTLRNNKSFRFRTIKKEKSVRYNRTVAEGLYIHRNYSKKIKKSIRSSPLGEKEYAYSGLAFFLIPEIIEKLSEESYENFLYKNVYHRLGAYDIVFNPFRFYNKTGIVPTETDTVFRKQLIHGYVHDEGAAMMGGFSGNAGLFATANDLIKLMELYRRDGYYGNQQIIRTDVIREYTEYQFPDKDNRRGLGFDKPLINENDGTVNDYPCPGASPTSYGHSGFTGTFAWVDPEHEISYVFLSNRVYPTRNNSLLSDLNIRTEILQSVYDSVIDQ